MGKGQTAGLDGIIGATMPRVPRIVLDTNVLYAAMRSSKGASYRLLQLVGGSKFQVVVSVPLVLEYEHALAPLPAITPITVEDIAVVLDYLCATSHRQEIFFLWRPTLRDPGDDMVLEVAVAGSCQFIVTFNIRDFVGADRFGIEVLTPADFLTVLGELP
ncbi:MAG: putative toxin-antitoxin system toxin component, PIN family [Acidobacteriota bacterium]